MSFAPKPPYYAPIKFEFAPGTKTVVCLDYDATLVVGKPIDPDDSDQGSVAVLNKQPVDLGHRRSFFGT